MRKVCVLLFAVALVLAVGCSTTSKATDFNGLTDLHGQKVMHLNTSNVAIHLLFKDPILSDATLQQTVSDLTREAKEAGASQVRVVQSDTTTLWWILPPISFIVHPVLANAAADAR